MFRPKIFIIYQKLILLVCPLSKNLSLNRMSRDFIKELDQLNNPRVHIKHKENVNKLINDIVNGGTKKLQVVSDFDRTITKQHEDGKPHLSSFGIFAKCKTLPNEYVEAECLLKNKYFPIEIDPTIPLPEKKALMEEWWNLSEKLLVGLNVTESDINEVVSKYGPSLRDGSENVFIKLRKANVPVLVFSAGLGDAVVAVLKHFNVLLPNVKVVSNFLDRDENNVIKGFKDKMINVYNKNEMALQGTEYYDLVHDRENIIVMGDSLGDAEMADGVPHSKAVLKIGFLYDHIKESLPGYMERFDIVLEDDQTMDVLNALLSLMD